MEYVAIIIMSSLIGITIVEDLLRIPSKTYSKYLLVDIIIQMLKCSLCFSYWFCAFTWLIWFGTFWGFYFGYISYWLTFLFKKHLFNVL